MQNSNHDDNVYKLILNHKNNFLLYKLKVCIISIMEVLFL